MADKKAEPAESKVIARARRAVFRPPVLILLAILAAAATLGPYVVRRLPEMSESDDYRFGAAAVDLGETPEWAPADLVEQVVEASELPEHASILDPELAARLASGFQSHPWVERVNGVRVHRSGRVSVDVVFRKPVAMIRVKQGLYPVDAAGSLLPPQDFSAAEAGRFPVVENVASAPQGPAGTKWGDVVVTGAARLAAKLEGSWKTLELKAIHAPERTKAVEKLDDLSYRLTTAGGSTIIWGRPPGSGHPGELSTDQKLGRLKKYRRDFGGFDGPHGPYEIDIRHWREISRLPLADGARL